MMSAPTKRLICIEGLIGAGKSTVMNFLKDAYRDSPHVAFVDEPVELWDSHGMLEAMYTGKLNGGMFQAMALTTRVDPLMAALHSDATVIITERSPWSDHYCFARINLSKIEMKAYGLIFSRMQNWMERYFDLDVSFVYLRTSVDVAMQRIVRRARASEMQQEQDSIMPVAYLDKIFEAHEAFFALAAANRLGGGHCVSSGAPLRANPRMTTRAMFIDVTLEEASVIAQKAFGFVEEPETSVGSAGPTAADTVQLEPRCSVPPADSQSELAPLAKTQGYAF
tara:strand:+ start:211 stop:1053 length:843 start_codon:yes stop_codon:yes gene_type:complete